MKMDVWLEAYERRIGVLERADDKSLTFTYDAETPETGRISLSLPVRREPYTDAACRGYFENLMFEGPQLDRVLTSYQLDRGDIGSLLFHLGADCPGAISITPAGTGPGKRPGSFPQDYDLVSDARIAEIVRSLHVERRLPEDEVDPSPIAGVQGKIAVVFQGDQYFLPKAGSRAPTTHILKVSPVREPSLTLYEAALLSMATDCGIRTTNFARKTFPTDGGTINAILLERFDRSIENNLIRRVHAEDFCQALGLAPSLKYERGSLSSDHKFSAKAVGTIAAKTSAPGVFIEQFLDQTLYNLMVGNTDNHGKNASILHGNLATELAPLYDVVPIFMDTAVTHQFAFNIGAAHYAEDLSTDDVLAMMNDLGFKRPKFDKRLERKLRLIVQVVANEAERAAEKNLADGLAAQIGVVADALKIDLGAPERDYFNRMTRDEKHRAGGWSEVS